MQTKNPHHNPTTTMLDWGTPSGEPSSYCEQLANQSIQLQVKAVIHAAKEPPTIILLPQCCSVIHLHIHPTCFILVTLMHTHTEGRFSIDHRHNSTTSAGFTLWGDSADHPITVPPGPLFSWEEINSSISASPVHGCPQLTSWKTQKR